MKPYDKPQISEYARDLLRNREARRHGLTGNFDFEDHTRINIQHHTLWSAQMERLEHILHLLQLSSAHA